MSRSLLSGAATAARKVRNVLYRSDKSGSHSKCAKRHVTSALPRNSKNSEVASPTDRVPQTHSTTALTSVSASGEAVSIQSRTLNPQAAAWSGLSTNTRCPILRRAASSIGPSSAAGSSTTAEPVQVSKVETALVVLNEPDPATTSEWVDPSTQGSTSSGARPPSPQVAGLRGLNGPARLPRIISLADHDPAKACPGR